MDLFVKTDLPINCYKTVKDIFINYGKKLQKNIINKHNNNEIIDFFY